MTLYTLNNRDLHEGTPPEGARVLVDAGEVARLARGMACDFYQVEVDRNNCDRSPEEFRCHACTIRRALLALTGESE